MGELGGHLEIRGSIGAGKAHGMVVLAGRHFTLETDEGRYLKAWTK